MRTFERKEVLQNIRNFSFFKTPNLIYEREAFNVTMWSYTVIDTERIKKKGSEGGGKRRELCHVRMSPGIGETSVIRESREGGAWLPWSWNHEGASRDGYSNTVRVDNSQRPDARSRASLFHIVSLNVCNYPCRWVRRCPLSLSRWGNWGLSRLSHLSKITQSIKDQRWSWILNPKRWGSACLIFAKGPLGLACLPTGNAKTPGPQALHCLIPF